jgi:hypothetical protein
MMIPAPLMMNRKPAHVMRRNVQGARIESTVNAPTSKAKPTAMSNMAAAWRLLMTFDGSRRQSVEQRLSLFQIARVKPFGEPAVDRSEKLASLIPLALVAP